MTPKEVVREKANTELMVLDALQRFTRTTNRHVRSIDFDFKPEPDGTQREFIRVTLHLDENTQ